MIVLIRNQFTILLSRFFQFFKPRNTGFFCLLFCLLNFHFKAFGQDQVPDLSAITKEDKVDTLLSLANTLARNDFETALQYSHEGLELARELSYHKGEVGAFLALGRIQIIRSKYDSAHLLLKKADDLIGARRLPALKSQLLDTYGWLAQREEEFEKSIHFHKRAYQALTEFGSPTEASIYMNLGITYYFMSEFDSAKSYYEKGLAINTALKDSLGMLNGYRNIGIVLRRKGNLREAIRLYFDALRIAEQLKLQSSIADVHNSIGVAFDHLKEYDQALEHYQQTLDIRRQLSDRRRLGNVLSNIGWIYSELEQLDKALEAHLESLRIAEEIGGHNASNAAFNNIGLVYKEMGKYDSAYLYFQKSLEEYASIDDKRGIALAANNISSNHFAQKQYVEAIAVQLEYLPLIEEYGAQRTKMIAYQRLYGAYKILKQTQSALKYHELYKLAADSIFDVDKTAELYELSVKYETEKKEKELAFKDEQITTLQQLADLRKKLLFTSIGALLVISTLIVLVIYFRNQRRKKVMLAQTQLMEVNLKNEQLETERVGLKLKSKEKELLSFALNLTQKNDLLRRMKEIIEKKVKHKGTLKADFRELETLIDSNDQSEKEWESFKHLFQELHHDFFNKLKLRHPDLSIYETRLCALIKLNLSSTEMAGMLNISISSLTSARYRLRKKMNLSGKDDLNQYIEAFNGVIA
ncbi:MAG: tetratricopeptide repeat protein [Roseivirga sp.]|nr:tetratricopeptide repeat protein [Roseivirga sp.]